MNSIFSNINYKDIVDLFNNISKFTFYTFKFVSSDISYNSYRLKCRSMIETKISSKAIIALEPREYKNLNDECLYINLLHNDHVSVHLIVDINATYEDEPKLKIIPRIFNDSIYHVVILTDGRIFEESTDNLGNILYIERIIYNILFGLSNNDQSEQFSTTLSKLFTHILFNYEDEWIKEKWAEEIVQKCLSNKQSTPIMFNYEKDYNLIECIEEICILYIL